MTIEQTARDLLEAMEVLYMNDFGGYQCNSDDGDDIDIARRNLERALAAEVMYRQGQGRAEQRQQRQQGEDA